MASLSHLTIRPIENSIPEQSIFEHVNGRLSNRVDGQETSPNLHRSEIGGRDGVDKQRPGASSGIPCLCRADRNDQRANDDTVEKQ